MYSLHSGHRAHPPKSEVQRVRSERDARQLCGQRLCLSYAAQHAVSRPSVRARGVERGATEGDAACYEVVHDTRSTR